VLVPLLWLLLSPAPDGKAAAGSRQEVEFGVEVARKGLWQEARFRFEKAIAADPDNPEALNNLAVALEQQGDFDKAREAYEKALKLKPGSVYIQQNFDLFREADDKRNRKAKKKKTTAPPQP
jgi:Flp pilus assembly protein TadD